MSGRILIIDSVATNRIVLKVKLASAQYAVETCASCADAQKLMNPMVPDLILINMSDPKEDRHAYCRQLRQQPGAERLVIVGICVPDNSRARFAALDAGADDYLTKPFNRDELIARIHAIVRRSKGHADPVISQGELQVDPVSHSVFWSGKSVDLSAREFAILHTLLLNAGRVMSKAQIEEQLYGWGEEIESNAIEVFVHHLRRKLSPQLIRTIRGVGYMIEKTTP